MHPLSLSCVAMLSLAPTEVPIVPGITFAGDQSLYAPLRDLASAMRWIITYEPEAKRVHLEGQPIREGGTRRTLSGETLVRLDAVPVPGARVVEVDEGVRVEWGALRAVVKPGEKRVEINLTKQRLTAYQGDRAVLETQISSGRRGYSTPTGTFSAGPAKHRMHYSTLYGNSPMPWSVQVSGNIFIHGYHSVPPRPASHGCIRVPIKDGNPAKWLFEWIEIGTPIHVFYEPSGA